jgi:hypothetical protein
MIEHTMYYMGKILFVQKFQHVYELGPTEKFAWPGQILGRLQSITMYLYATKTAPIIRSAKQDDIYGASNIVLPCPGS